MLEGLKTKTDSTTENEMDSMKHNVVLIFTKNANILKQLFEENIRRFAEIPPDSFCKALRLQ